RYRLDTYGYFYRNLPLKNGHIQARSHFTDARSFPSSTSIVAKRSTASCSGIVHHLSQSPIYCPPRSPSSLSEMESVESIEEEEAEDVLDWRRCTMNDKGSVKEISGSLHLSKLSMECERCSF
ncbi:hypothetical protein PENTCL1PPCAC_20563, partial [Pristionchus entomophagus]